MDLDKEFVGAILKEGDKALKSALEKGINAEHLLDEGKIAWTFIIDYKKQYGQLPSKSLLLGSVTDEKGKPLDLNAGLGDSSEALADKLLERKVLNLLFEGTKKVTDQIAKRNAKEAAEVFQEIHRKLLKEQLTASKVESLFALGTKVIAYYDLVKSGGRGIPTPWQSMDKQTMGWWPEDLILIVGKRGTGKTFALLLCSQAAWMPGHKVLICTTEMPRETLAGRFLCMHLRIPYGDYRDGRLGEFVEKKFRDGVSALLNEQGIDMIGKGFDFTIDNLEAAVEDTSPALLIVDGAYLIKNQGKDRHERVSNTFNDFKRIGIRRGIPIITSTQFNRAAKTGQEETVSADNIAITDVAIWNASAAFGMTQTEEMFAQRLMGWKSLKIREGRPYDFECNWDLVKMEFSENVTSLGDPVKPNVAANTIQSPFPQNEDDDDLPDVPF